MHPEQKLLLKEDLRKTNYEKLNPLDYKKHTVSFKNQKFKDNLIEQWEKNTNQKWPTYEKNIYNPKTGKEIGQEGKKYQAHHIVPQQLGGKHEWWNMHPVPTPEHQNIVHGSSGVLNEILKELGKK